MKTFTVDATDANWEILGEACAFMLLPGLETKMTYIKAISNEQKGK